jgi:hypothetical protein
VNLRSLLQKDRVVVIVTEIKGPPGIFCRECGCDRFVMFGLVDRPCTCVLADDGDIENGPHLHVVGDPECPLHGDTASGGTP